MLRDRGSLHRNLPCFVVPHINTVPPLIRRALLVVHSAEHIHGPTISDSSMAISQKSKASRFDLLEQLTFYGSYHNNKWNQLIHFFFVPSIMWSLAVVLAASGPLVQLPLELLSRLPSWLSSSVQLNAAFFGMVGYCLYYLVLEPFAGLTWAAAVGVPIWLTATAFEQQVTGAWNWALLVHVFSWYMQIHPGHAILEGRKPALLDSLGQAVTLAPLFVWFELLFLLGYQPQLHAQLQQRVNASIAAYKAEKHIREKGA